MFHNSKYAAVIIPLVLAASTLTVMAGTAISPVINKMRDALGVSPAVAGLIITTHSLFVAFLSPVIGHAIDKIGTRKPLIAGLFLYAIAGGAGFFTDSLWPLVVSRAFMGAAVAAIFVSITVIITDLFAGTERNVIMGRRVSFNNFGGVIWPLLGGFLGTYSWHSPFLIYLVAIPLALSALFVLPETHNRTLNTEPSGDSLMDIFKSTPKLIVIFGLVLLTTVVLYTIIVFLPQLLEELGLSNTLVIGSFISIMTLSASATAFVYGKIKAGFSYRYIVRVALLVWIFALSAIATTSSEIIIAGAVSMTGMAFGVMLPALLVWVGEISPREFSGRIISFTGTFAYFGQFLAPLALGPAVLIIGPSGAFLIMALISAVVLISLALFSR
jgi:ACDE family multidrug resistance protein